MPEHIADYDACPACGGREWSTASDGLGEMATVAAACLSCSYVTSSTIDTSTTAAEGGDKRDARIVAVEAVAERWEGVLAECKEADQRWILDQSVMTLDSCLRELRRALKTYVLPPGGSDA